MKISCKENLSDISPERKIGDVVVDGDIVS